MARKVKVELEAGAVNETPPLSHWQFMLPVGRSDEATVMLRSAVRLPHHPPRQFARAELGATTVDIPLGEEEARHLLEVLKWAIEALDAEQKGNLN